MPAPDEIFMARALELAWRGRGKTGSNPMVGAVLVRGGKIISEGWHKRDGGPHAEAECLKKLRGESATGAVMYSTLEPCSTHGRTGACTDLIISAGISSVKIGALDPNPVHSGAALEIFARHGIGCETGILGGECADLNFIYNRTVAGGAPVVALKYAQSADGKIAAKPGARTRIGGAEEERECMELRELFDAVAVGHGTLLADDPSLTARRGSRIVKCPRRILFDAALSVAEEENPARYKIFSDEFRDKTAVVCDADADEGRIARLEGLGIKVVQVPCPKDSPVFWTAVRDYLRNEKIASLMVEGGAGLLSNICRARAADYAFEYTSPVILGRGGVPAFAGGKNFKIPAKPRKLGRDTALRGEIVWTRKM